MHREMSGLKAAGNREEAKEYMQYIYPVYVSSELQYYYFSYRLYTV
jgi:hypothetical protein